MKELYKKIFAGCILLILITSCKKEEEIAPVKEGKEIAGENLAKKEITCLFTGYHLEENKEESSIVFDSLELFEKITFFYSGVQEVEYTFERDKIGKINKFFKNYFGEEIDYTGSISYDSIDRMSEIVRADSKETFEYNSAGEMIKYTSYIDNIIDSQFHFTYNFTGDIIKKKVYTPNESNQLSLVETVSYEYDTKSNPFKNIAFFAMNTDIEDLMPILNFCNHNIVKINYEDNYSETLIHTYNQHGYPLVLNYNSDVSDVKVFQYKYLCK